MKHRHPADTTFMQRTGAGIRQHWIGATVATLISVLTSTIVPLVEQWHSDKLAADSVREAETRCMAEAAEVETRLQREIDELKRRPGR